MPPAYAPKDQPVAAGVDISVVIPSYNGARTIVDCLESIERATRGRQREIIVADSSEDATPEIVLRRFPSTTLIRSRTRLSAGAARNVGAAAAHGRLVFFTDQDCIVPEDWVDRMEEHFRDSSIGGAGGAVAIRNLSSASGCAMYFLEFLNQFPGNGSPRRDENFLVGCNAAYRSEVVRAVRFPDQTLGEDVLFAHQLRAQGFHTVYDPRIEVLHQNREGWREFFEYNYKMGCAAAGYHDALKLWWTAPFLRRPSLVFSAPFFILPTIALSLLRSSWSYLLRFLLLTPMCFLGNLAWANGFWQQTHEIRAKATATLLVDPLQHPGNAPQPPGSQP